MPTPESIALMIRRTSGVELTSGQVTVCAGDGYAVTELDRPDAYRVARHIMYAMEVDPESGDAAVRVISPRGGGASWRGHSGTTVRVEFSR